eukprot:161016_1
MFETLRGAAVSALQHTALRGANGHPNQGSDNGSFVNNGSIINPPLGSDADRESRLERVRILHGELETCLKKLELDEDSGHGEVDHSGSSRMGHPASTCPLQVIECMRALAETVVRAEKVAEPSVFQLFCELGCLNMFTETTRGKWKENIALQRQVFQSMSLLMHNITDHVSLYLLLSNNHINKLIDQERAHLLLEDEEFLGEYVSFLKVICLRLSGETVHFFLNESLNSFPLFLKVAPLLTISNDTMVQTSAMTMILYIYQVEDPGLHRFLSRSENVLALSRQIVSLFRCKYSLLLSRMKYVEEAVTVRGMDCSGVLHSAVGHFQDCVCFIKDLLCVSVRCNRQYVKEMLVPSEMFVGGVIASFLSSILPGNLAKGPISAIDRALEIESKTRKKDMYLTLFVVVTLLHSAPGSILSSHIIDITFTEVNIAVVSYLLDAYDVQGHLIALVVIRSLQQGFAANKQAVLPLKERSDNDAAWIKLYSGVFDFLDKQPLRQLSAIQLSCTILAAAEKLDWKYVKCHVEQALISAAVAVLGWVQEQLECNKAIIELRAAAAGEINLEMSINDLICGPTLLLPPESGSDATARSAFTVMKAFLLWLRFITEKFSVAEPDHTEVGVSRERGQKGTNGSKENCCDKTEEEVAAAVRKQKSNHDNQDGLQGDNNGSNEACSSAADKAICCNVEEYGHVQEDTKSTPSHSAIQVGAIDSNHAAAQNDDKCGNPSSECVGSISVNEENNNGVSTAVVAEQNQKQGRETELIQEEQPSSMLNSSSSVVPKVDVGMTASRGTTGKSSQSKWNAILEPYQRVLGIHDTPECNIGECVQLEGKNFYPCIFPKGWPTSCPKGKTRLGILLYDNDFYLSSTNVSVSSATVICSIPYMLLWGSPHPMDGRVLELSFPSSSPPHLVHGSELFLLGRPPGPGKSPKWTQLLLTLSSAHDCSSVADIIREKHDDSVSKQCEMMSALLKTLIEDIG